MAFQQLLSGLADEHRRLERERNELSEEVSRLRRQLRSSRGERLRTQEALPGQLPPAGPRGADGGGGAHVFGGASEHALPEVPVARDDGGADVPASRHSALGELGWQDDREHMMSRYRQNARFLEIFGLGLSQQYSYRITAENLKQVLAKRGLGNPKDTFLEWALQELARVSPHRPSQIMSPEVRKPAAFSSILPIHRKSESSDPQCPVGISFEAFVAAILMPDLPKLVEPRLSRGIEKMQEALLKQDVEEVIAKLSRKRAALTEDMDPDNIGPTTKGAWTTTRIDAALNVVVALTVLASIFSLGLSKETDPGWEGWTVLEVVFAGIFVADSVLRITIHGSRVFWCGPDRHWNWLDVFISVLTVGDVCLAFVVQESGGEVGWFGGVIRTLRIMRFCRLLKIMRSPMIRELSNMLLGFVLGSPALFWVSIILWVVVALLAMGLRIAVGPDPGDEVLVEKCGPADSPLVMVDADPDCGRHVLYAEEFCGTLPKCMFTVFRCMIGDCTSSSGQSLAAHLSAGYGTRFDFVYLTGMIVMIFGLFNVITAIFVEATMAGLKYSETKQKLRSAYEHQHVKRKLEELVSRIQFVSQRVQKGKGKDTLTDSPLEASITVARPFSPNTRRSTTEPSQDLSEDPNSVASINLTEDEFFAVVEDDVVLRILQQLDIEVEGASKEALFDIMDPNTSGTVDVASVIDTLMKLRGGPMKVDMIAPSVAIRELQQELRRLGSGLASLAAADSAGGGASPKAPPMVASRLEWFNAEDFR